MIIVKIGGGAAINLEGVAADLAELDEPFVAVHGANALRDRLAEALGRPVKRLESLSGFQSVYSDEGAIELMMMAYSGLANKRLVAALQRFGVNAVGLTGIDGGLIRGRRNRGVRVRRDGKKLLVRDFSGKPETVNVALLRLLLNQGCAPVLTVPILDEQGVAINTENDEIVALLRDELEAHTVIQLIEAPGLLANSDDPRSLVPRLAPSELAAWESRTAGRMKRKIMALAKLYRGGAPRTLISDGRTSRPIAAALAGAGTVIA